ncbi:MAG: hypothetical protein ACK46M_20180 [Planctomyces sp.]
MERLGIAVINQKPGTQKTIRPKRRFSQFRNDRNLSGLLRIPTQRLRIGICSSGPNFKKRKKRTFRLETGPVDLQAAEHIQQGSREDRSESDFSQ